jgi:hypothetical protein
VVAHLGQARGPAPTRIRTSSLVMDIYPMSFKMRISGRGNLLCQKLEQLEEGQKIVGTMLHYVLSRGRLKSKEAFVKFVNKEFGQERGAEMMTLAEQLKAEGFQEGEKRGEKLGEKKGMVRTKLEMAVKLIREGLDLPFVAKVTELPMSQLQELARSSVE